MRLVFWRTSEKLFVPIKDRDWFVTSACLRFVYVSVYSVWNQSILRNHPD